MNSTPKKSLHLLFKSPDGGGLLRELVQATGVLTRGSVRVGPTPPPVDGLLEVPVPIESERLFLRLRITQKN